MRYDVILWDTDDTLLDFSYSQKHSLSKCLVNIGIDPTEEIIAKYAKINDKWWKRLELGEVTKKELLKGRFVDLFRECKLDCPDIDDFLSKYQTGLGEIYSYMENSLEVCKSLKGICRQFVITNGVTATQLNKLKLSGFYDIMENVFISEQIGVPKPQRGFFERVLETMPEVPKNRILIVGDSLTSDIRGGNMMDIDTCWYNPNDQLNEIGVEATFNIRSLKEVKLIIEG